MAKTALITGIAGQDGSYLAELLLAKGYFVHGTVRHDGPTNLGRVEHLLDRIAMHQVDACDSTRIAHLLDQTQPDEIYNLVSHSFVPASWQQPVQTAEYSAVGVTRLLESIVAVNPTIRFFQAGSSEMFGHAADSPQSETTRMCPTNPYAVAKLFGHWTTVSYREKYGLFACSGILFNHESPRRNLEFVTRKIAHEAAKIKLGYSRELRLGNLSARRDWGFAGDHVRALWMMLQHETAGDYVIGTGQTHTVQQLVEAAFDHLGLDWQKYVTVDAKLLRPADACQLVANPAKARKELCWQPTVDFQGLVAMMVDADLARLSNTEGDSQRFGQLPAA
jgi:GDPmannose 4,6-dehydratase